MPSDKLATRGRYCGLYSLYGAAQALGMEVPISELLYGEFVSRDGSTIGQLRRAAEHLGLETHAMTGMTIDSLLSSPYPVLLHVTPRSGCGARHQFDHWVVFLGFDRGKARVIDSPEPFEKLAKAELLAIWDGTGIAVSLEETTWWDFGPSSLLGLAPLGLCLLMGVVVARTAASRQFPGPAGSQPLAVHQGQAQDFLQRTGHPLQIGPRSIFTVVGLAAISVVAYCCLIRSQRIHPKPPLD